MIALEVAIVLLLVLLNGFFAMAELAVVSARRGRLQRMAREGNRGAQAALALAAHPGRFLSAVQIGITLIGILAGAFGGATLAASVERWLARIPVLRDYAEPLAFAGVVIVITYLSLIIGELAPKQLALRNAERVAAITARPLTFLARLASPLVSLLDASTRLVLRLIGARQARAEAVSEEEIKALIAEGARTGALQPVEQQMLEDVLRMADRPVRAVMTPRRDVMWLDPDEPREQWLREIRNSDFSRILVSRGDIDNVVGMVRKKDLLNLCLDGKPIDLMQVVRQPLVVPDSTSILRTLELFKRQPAHLAIVVDEYGSLEGVVTQTDLLEAITGDLPGHADEPEATIVPRKDGSYLIDGMTDIDDVRRALDLPTLPEGEYQTIAGFVLQQLSRIPKSGDSFIWGGWEFEVMDMDRRRIDKVLATRQSDAAASSDAATD